MIIEIIFRDASAPKRIEADNCYTKGDFFCIRVKNMLIKYPMKNIFSVCHEHGFHWGSSVHLKSLRAGDEN
jgi:hypothetical protein